MVGREQQLPPVPRDRRGSHGTHRRVRILAKSREIRGGRKGGPQRRRGLLRDGQRRQDSEAVESAGSFRLGRRRRRRTTGAGGVRKHPGARQGHQHRGDRPERFAGGVRIAGQDRHAVEHHRPVAAGDPERASPGRLGLPVFPDRSGPRHRQRGQDDQAVVPVGLLVREDLPGPPFERPAGPVPVDGAAARLGGGRRAGQAVDRPDQRVRNDAGRSLQQGVGPGSGGRPERRRGFHDQRRRRLEDSGVGGHDGPAGGRGAGQEGRGGPARPADGQSPPPQGIRQGPGNRPPREQAPADPQDPAGAPGKRDLRLQDGERGSGVRPAEARGDLGHRSDRPGRRLLPGVEHPGPELGAGHVGRPGDRHDGPRREADLEGGPRVAPREPPGDLRGDHAVRRAALRPPRSAALQHVPAGLHAVQHVLPRSPRGNRRRRRRLRGLGGREQARPTAEIRRRPHPEGRQDHRGIRGRRRHGRQQRGRRRRGQRRGHDRRRQQLLGFRGRWKRRRRRGQGKQQRQQQ
mmetsp:Transcript_1081/g.2484  ORF Transcript_1081/g.2484 Transcript_1081/m.2484 type:complete len:518 (+) Transcript_1081:952-2505(+)